MTAIEAIKALKETFQKDVVTFHAALGNVDGCNAHDALFLSEIMHWSKFAEDGWVFRTQEEIQEKCLLSEYYQRKARRFWGEEGEKAEAGGNGVLMEEKKGIPARLYYKVNWEKLAELIAGGSDDPEEDSQNSEDVENNDENPSKPCFETVSKQEEEPFQSKHRNRFGSINAVNDAGTKTYIPRAREPLFEHSDGLPDGIELPTAVGKYVYGKNWKNGKDGNGGVSENARTEFFGLLRDTAKLWGKAPVNRALGELKVGLPDNPEAIARYMKPILVKQVKIERQRILDQREFEERRKRHTKELPDENKARRLLHRLEGKTGEDEEDAGAA